MEENSTVLDLGIVPIENTRKGGEGHACTLICNLCGSGAIKVPIGG